MLKKVCFLVALCVVPAAEARQSFSIAGYVEPLPKDVKALNCGPYFEFTPSGVPNVGWVTFGLRSDYTSPLIRVFSNVSLERIKVVLDETRFRPWVGWSGPEQMEVRLSLWDFRNATCLPRNRDA